MKKHVMLLLMLPLSLFASNNPFGLDRPSNAIQQIIQIHYAKASTMAKLIRPQLQQALGKNVVIIADDRTNRIWLQGPAQAINTTKNLIKILDIPQAQVLIKAKIMVVDSQYAHRLGVSFATGDADPHLTDNNHLILPIAKLADKQYLNIKLQALTKTGHAKVISNPELMTSNRHAALIESGQDIPYQQATGQGNTSIAFKQAALKLKVLPIVLPNDKILLKITVNQDKVSQLQVQGVPAISTQQLTTQVIVHNKHTVVLGGIYETNTSQAKEGIPLLDDLPVFGQLFQVKQQQRKRQELLIFVTPTIAER